LQRIADIVPDSEKARWTALKPRYIQVQEQENREVRAIIIAEDGRTHLVIGPDYRLVTLPLNNYDPAQMQFGLRGDFLNRLVTVNSDHYVEAVVLNRDYEFVDRYTETLPERKDHPSGKLAGLLFPFTLDLEDDASGFIGFHFSLGRPIALAVNAGLLLLALAWLLFRKRVFATHLPELIAVALTGVFGLAMFFLVPRAE
jgi:hypothetical protein